MCGLKMKMLAAAFAVCLITLSGTVCAEAASGRMTITAIDLGGINTGEATMITAGDGGALLVDSGDNHNRAVFDWLYENGYENRKFNTLVTHWHDDHAGNTAKIIREFNVGTVYIPETAYLEEISTPYYRYERGYYTKVIDAAKDRGTKVVYLRKGQTIRVGSGVSGKVLYISGSPRSESERPVDHINNQSAVIMFSGGGCKYLNCGDLCYEGERRVLKSGQSIKADIYKVSHHGYNTSNAQAFLNAVDPTYAYFTAHDSSPSGYMPAIVAESVERISKMANVFGTRYNGTIRFVCSGGKVTASAQRNTKTMYQKLIAKSSGKTKTEKYIFNKQCFVRHFDRIVDTDTYYNQQLTAKGSMFTGSWTQIGGRWYLMDSGGMCAHNTVAVKNGRYYFFGPLGQRLENGWRTIRGYKYYFAPQRLKGFRKIGDKVYYFMDERCTAYKGSKEGIMLTGFRIINGSRYYFIDSRYKGYKTSLHGVRASGWTTVAGNVYYMSSGGCIQRGMRKIEGSYYCFSGTGIMQKGLKKIGGSLYFFANDGKRVSGWKTISGKKYYFQVNGKALVKIDKTIGNRRYRFDENGVMIKEINCHLDKNGNPIIGWHTIGDKTYYAYDDGELATGKVIIDGVEYEFDTVENGCALLTKEDPENTDAGDTSGETAPETEPGEEEQGTEAGLAGDVTDPGQGPESGDGETSQSAEPEPSGDEPGGPYEEPGAESGETSQSAEPEPAGDDPGDFYEDPGTEGAETSQSAEPAPAGDAAGSYEEPGSDEEAGAGSETEEAGAEEPDPAGVSEP